RRKNSAPPPRKGSKYRRYVCGARAISSSRSRVLPPTHLTIGADIAGAAARAGGGADIAGAAARAGGGGDIPGAAAGGGGRAGSRCGGRGGAARTRGRYATRGTSQGLRHAAMFGARDRGGKFLAGGLPRVHAPLCGVFRNLLPEVAYLSGMVRRLIVAALL